MAFIARPPPWSSQWTEGVKVQNDLYRLCNVVRNLGAVRGVRLSQAQSRRYLISHATTLAVSPGCLSGWYFLLR